jgi:hypothetical protein
VCNKAYVDLLYLRHVYNLVTAVIKGGYGHRQTISMSFGKFCQVVTGTNFSTRLQQWPTDELLREPFHKIPCGHSPLKVMIMSQMAIST